MAQTSPAPILLLLAPDEDHPFDLYLAEIMRIEGYHCFDQRVGEVALTPAELARYSLAIISCGAAAHMSRETVAQYLAQGGRVIAFRPPTEWSELFGLGAPGPTYAVTRNAYLHVNGEHPWLTDFPALDLQCHGGMDVYPNASAEPLAFVAGQLGLPSAFPAVVRHEVGAGVGVLFAYDLAECVVRFHQGRPENASTGPDPDANRDGKFTSDDLLEGMRDFRLRHVPQADVHQDLLVRAIRGLAADLVPLPRLWHFPRSAPGLLFVNGDGDGMNWDDLRWTVETCAAHEAKFTFYLMDAEIDAFSAGDIAAMRARGHAFGPHPWTGLQPTIEEWGREIVRIVARFEEKLGFRPRSLRSHCVIFPGWDESPRLFAEAGLRLDTNFLSGYRYQSGLANGSGLPVRFIGRTGEIIDCYEQCTLHGDDVMCSPKSLLPPYSEDQALEVSRQVMHDCATRYHGVYHPYFHPLYLGGRGGLPTRRWFTGVLQAAREQGMPSVNADEWLSFTDARRETVVADVHWDGEMGRLGFTLTAASGVCGLTLLLPPCCGRVPESATVDDAPVAIAPVPHEKIGWTALEIDLEAGERRGIAVAYGPASA
jgi:hypothetical protein